METHNLTLSALRDKIGNKEISAVEVVKAYKNRIEEQKDLNAVITTDFDNALCQAEKIDKDIAAGKYGDVRIVVGSLSDDVYEELLLKSFVVAKLKTDDETKRADVRNIVAAIDNWANCDMFVARCKFIGKDREKWFDYLTEYLESDKEYDLRFAIVAMMTYYLTDEYIDRVLALSSKVKSDKYYVKMAVAWLMATALCKFPDKALDVIKSNVLDVWTHNKALQKARESFRIDKSQKDYLNTLKRK